LTHLWILNIILSNCHLNFQEHYTLCVLSRISSRKWT
jgi:hypothetical protein